MLAFVVNMFVDHRNEVGHATRQCSGLIEENVNQHRVSMISGCNSPTKVEASEPDMMDKAAVGMQDRNSFQVKDEIPKRLV